ncbi:hypothetical protein TthSNM11_09880 [Thermus thermophilus]|nr:hypothetical protein TthSNM11_09880 [Thermus thermophilus]
MGGPLGEATLPGSPPPHRPGPGGKAQGGVGPLEPRPRRQAVGGEALGKDPRAPEEGEKKPQEPHA